MKVIILSVNLYDNSLLQKLKYWTENTNVTVYNVEDATRLVQVMADNINDQPIKLPIIAIKRTAGFTIKNPNKRPASFDGLHQIASEDKVLYDKYNSQFLNHEISQDEYLKKCSELKRDAAIISLNVVPISIPYQIDVYTRTQKENDLYMRNLIFNLINYPTLQVHFNYNGIDIVHNGNIILQDNVSTDSPNIKLFPDQICRQSLSILIDDAYLWDTRIRNSISISADGIVLEIFDGTDFIVETIQEEK